MSWNIAKPGDQINGPVAVTGNLNVDSNTLFVDSANNRVGVLTASPTVPLDVVGDAKVSGNLTVDTNTLVVDGANDRVGIGEASTGSKLHVKGTGVNIAALVDSSATGYSGLVLKGTGSQNFSIGMGGPSETAFSVANKFFLYDGLAGAMRLVVDSSGNLGLGVAPSAWQANWKVLQFANGSSIGNPYNGAGTFVGSNTYRNSSGDYVRLDADAAALYVQLTGSHRWHVAGTSTAGSTIPSFSTGSQAMILDQSGNLGLGVTLKTWGSAYKAIQVNTTGAVTSYSGAVILGNNYYANSSGNPAYITAAAAGAYAIVGKAHTWYRSTDATPVADGACTLNPSMTLDASGNLSVGGTPTGTGKFEIQGTTVGERILFSQTANNTAARTMFSIGYRTGGLNTTGLNSIVCATETQFDDSHGLKLLYGAASAVGIHVNYLGRVGIGMADSMLNRAQIQGAGQATATVSDNGDGSALFLSDTGSAANNGGLLFLGSASVNGQRPHVGIKSLLTDATANGTGDMAFLTRTTTGATTLTEKMRLLTNGNLVLGRTAPLFGSVSGRTTFTIDGSAGSIISWGYNGTVSTYIVADAAGTELGEARNQPVRFITNSTERLRIKATGQVNFVGLASDPAGAAAGDVYYNTTTNKLKCYNGTTWNDLF